MATSLADVLVAIFGASLGVSVKPTSMDVIGDGREPVADNLCNLSLYNQGSGDPSVSEPLSCNILVECKDGQTSYDITSDTCTDPNGWFKVTDDPYLGDFEVFFQPGASENAPWPGDVFVTLPQYTINNGGDESHDVPASGCKAWTEGFSGKDCDGNTVSLTACSEGFHDGQDHTLTRENGNEYGYDYHIAVPLNGAIACPSS